MGKERVRLYTGIYIDAYSDNVDTCESGRPEPGGLSESDSECDDESFVYMRHFRRPFNRVDDTYLDDTMPEQVLMDEGMDTKTCECSEVCR